MPSGRRLRAAASTRSTIPRADPLAGVSGEARDLLQLIVDRCLQKEPDRRYPTMAEPLEELKRARVQLEARGRLSRGARRAIWGGDRGVGRLASRVLLRRRREPDLERRLPIAVLQFENLSRGPGLRLVTAFPTCSRRISPSLPSSRSWGRRLYPFSPRPAALERAPTREVIERSRPHGVRSVRGSFAKAGDTMRISARLEDAKTGRVLMSEKAEAVGEENLFRLVDEITSRIKARFELTPPGEGLDRDLRDVTTASVEAYRSTRKDSPPRAFPRGGGRALTSASGRLDPGFAMALAKLGVVMSNLGRHAEGDEYAEKALEHVDRLSERERLYIEGWPLRLPSSIGAAIGCGARSGAIDRLRPTISETSV
jgi:TolB-like protein